MSQQTYKILRQYAKAINRPYELIKHAWDRSSDQERQEQLPRIKEIITFAKLKKVEEK